MLIRAILLFLLSSPAFALVEFPIGKCELEGMLTKQDGLWHFIVNPKTNSEIRLRLSAPPKNLKEETQFIKAEMIFKKTIRSYSGEAELKRIIRDLNPYKEPIRYTSKNIKESCNQKK